MARFVLVPGAWLEAWAWKGVTPVLEKEGHSAYSVTLTGMSDRVQPRHTRCGYGDRDQVYLLFEER